MNVSPARSTRSAKLVVGVGAMVAWLCFLFYWLRSFRPGSANVPMLNSDSAIPVLMANDSHWDLFQTFYYGQDRYGAWPFLLARAARPFLGVWTWERLHVYMTVWILAGSLLLALLSRAQRPIAALIYIAVIFAAPEIRYLMLEGHVYGWQLTAVLLAWWSFRSVLQSISAGEHPRQRAAALGLAFISSTLAIWSAVISAPILAALALVETWRSSSQQAGGSRWWRKLAEIAVLILVALAIEELLRKGYHDYASQHFGHNYRTALHLDRGHLGENTRVIFQVIRRFSWFPFWAGGLAAAIASGTFLIRRSRADAETHPSSRNGFLVESAFLIVSCAAAAVVQLPVLIGVDYVRINEHDARYFAPLQLFGSFAGLFAASTIVGFGVGSARARAAALWAATLGGFVAIAISLPAARPHEEYSSLREASLHVARTRPGTVVLGGYWFVYRFAAAQPLALLPLPYEGEYLRIPWHVLSLKHASQILVGRWDPPSAQTADPPAPLLHQYGNAFRLLIPNWYQSSSYHFALYENLGEDTRAGENVR